MGGVHKAGHFLIRNLRKLVVELAHSVKIGRLMEADDFIDPGAEEFNSPGRCYRHCDYDFPGILAADRLNGLQKGIAGGDSIVDQDNGFAFERYGLVGTGEQGILVPKGFPDTGSFQVDVIGINIQPGIKDPATETNRTNGKLGISGKSDFFCHQDIERELKMPGDVKGHGHAAPGNGHDYAIVFAVLFQIRKQSAGRFNPVSEFGDAIVYHREY